MVDFALESFSNVSNLDQLLDSLNEGPFGTKFAALNAAICEVVQDYGLVGFHPLCIEDKSSVSVLAKEIDKVFGIFESCTHCHKTLPKSLDSASE